MSELPVLDETRCVGSGDCDGSTKVFFAQEAGAGAVILWNGFGGFPFGNGRGSIIGCNQATNRKHQQTRKEHRAHHVTSIRMVFSRFQVSSCGHSLFQSKK